MENRTPIDLEGQLLTIVAVEVEAGKVTVTYEGLNGPDTVTVPDTMGDQAIRLTIRHREWTKKYPA